MARNRPHDGGNNLDREGIPDLETPLNQDEGIVAPGDRAIAADEFGVTAVEERKDEPLADRRTREIPEVEASDIDLRDAERTYDELDVRESRIVQPGDEEVDVYDNEKDAIAAIVDEDEGALSAEEAALHVTDRP